MTRWIPHSALLAIAVLPLVLSCTDDSEGVRTSPSSQPAISETVATTSPTVRPLPKDGEGVRVGETYSAHYNLHCGIIFLHFAGHLWRAEDPQPSVTGEPTRVEITYADEDTVRLTIDKRAPVAAGQVITFRPTEEEPVGCD